MSELITDEVFTDGQEDINASNMNGIISRAKVQPDVIANKPASVTLDVADQMLILKTDNTLARGRFDTIVNSTSSALPLADTTKNGMLRQVSGNTTDYVDGTNNCQPVTNLIPTGTVWDYLGATAPTGWLLLNGAAVSRTTYSALFALLGTTYGAGDGSTTFGLPDARGRTTIGAGTGAGLSPRTLGAKLGEETHAQTGAEVGVHYHPINDVGHTHTSPAHTHSDGGHQHTVTQGTTIVGLQAGGATMYNPAASATGVGYANIQATAVTISASGTGLANTTWNTPAGGTPFNVMQPSLVTNKIIKT